MTPFPKFLSMADEFGRLSGAVDHALDLYKAASQTHQAARDAYEACSPWLYFRWRRLWREYEAAFFRMEHAYFEIMGSWKAMCVIQEEIHEAAQEGTTA